jgi:anti-sigma factor RsiW
MKCPAEEKIEMFLGNELGDDEAAAIRAHIANCAACAALLEKMKKTDGAVKRFAPRPPGAGYMASLPDRIRDRRRAGTGAAGAAERTNARSAFRIADAVWRLVEIAAVFALIFAGSAFYTAKSINPAHLPLRSIVENGGGAAASNKTEDTSDSVFTVRKELFRVSKAGDSIY